MASGGTKFGTFGGVFTPSILTILGVILFLRTGWVVGNAGLAGAVGIVVIANAVTFATALSVGAVATNMRVGAGGAYYIISRSLGLELGGGPGGDGEDQAGSVELLGERRVGRPWHSRCRTSRRSRGHACDGRCPWRAS